MEAGNIGKGPVHQSVYLPNVSNYANIFPCIFLNFYDFCDVSEKNGLTLFTFGRVINHNMDLMHAKM